jgi:hypothetical protein
MGLWHWLTGTQDADPTILRRSAENLRRTLLCLNSDELPWAIRPDPRDDEILVATWKYADPRWQKSLLAAGMSTSIRICLFLDDERSTVRSIDEQVDVGLAIGGSSVSIEIGAFRGQKVEVGRSLTFRRDSDGHFRIAFSARFDTNDIKRTLQGVARSNGWAWKGVAFGRLKDREK